MNLFLQALSFLLQAVSFLCKFCLLKGQNSQKTELVIEKTKLAITKDRGCNTSCVFSITSPVFSRFWTHKRHDLQEKRQSL